MKKLQQKISASASVTTVIALTGLLLLGGIIVVLNSIDLAKSSKVKIETSLAQLRARTCFEESLQKIKYDHYYQDTFTINYADGTCQATVVDHDVIPDYKEITITSSVDAYSYQEEKLVDIATSPFDVID
jgi:hypothetical protein